MKTAILALLIFHGVWAWGQQDMPIENCTKANAKEVINDYECTSRGWVKHQYVFTGTAPKPNDTIWMSAMSNDIVAACGTKDDGALENCEITPGHTLTELLNMQSKSRQKEHDALTNYLIEESTAYCELAAQLRTLKAQLRLVKARKIHHIATGRAK